VGRHVHRDRRVRRVPQQTPRSRGATVQTDEFLSSGDCVVQIGRTRGRVLSTNREFDARELHVWRLRDGLVTSYEVFIDVPEMLAALAA